MSHSILFLLSVMAPKRSPRHRLPRARTRPMTTTDPVVWLNGSLLPQSQARLDPMARGFLHGMGVYDALLLRRWFPVALEKHAARLAAGAARLGLTAPAVEELASAISQVSQACSLPDARIRITV